MRSNVIFVLLILLLGGLGAGIGLRGRTAHEAPPPITPEPGATADVSAKADASNEPAADGPNTAEAAASSKPTAKPADEPAPPPFERPLRVVSLGWELVAAGVMANGGVAPAKDSFYAKKKLDVFLSAQLDAAKVENALARGGEDEAGADVAILPLPRFVASYERLKALDPVMFFVVGWSDGREVLLSGKHDSLDELPRAGKVKLDTIAGSAPAFLGLFTLDLAGVPPERIELVDDGKADWRALTRRQSKTDDDQTKGNLLVTTATASRLVPYVAIAQKSLATKHREALSILAEGWLEGHRLVAADPSGAARVIAQAKGAPEPLTVLSNLGTMAPASLAQNAHATGLSGRGAVTLEALFDRCWRLWREAKILTIPPERAPIDGSIVASLVRSGGKLDVPGAKSDDAPPEDATGNGPLLIHRLAGGPKDYDAEKVADAVGFIAGVFPRSPIELSIHPRVAHDADETKQAVEHARERFGLPEARLVASKVAGRPRTLATIRVMPVP